MKDGATTGKVSLVRSDFPHQPAVVNEHVFICRPSPAVDSHFLFYNLFSQEGQKRILEHFRGAAQGGITQEFADGTIVPIAPLAEQRRIVEKVETLLARVNAARARLARAPALLKAFRQAVINKSCADGDEIELADVLESIKYGTAMKCDVKAEGVPVLRIPNVVTGVVSLDDLKFATLPLREQEQLKLRVGDLLLVRSNGSVSLVGKSALVPQEAVGFAYAGYLLRLRTQKEVASAQYVHLALSTSSVRDQIEMPIRSTSGVHNINSDEVRRLQINLPSIPEQHEIVRRVESLFALADAIEHKVAAAQKRAEALTQGILAKAFRGELVPTEAALARAERRAYEPAAALLERVKKEKAPGGGERPAGRKTDKAGREGAVSTTDLHVAVLCRVLHFHQGTSHEKTLGSVKAEKIGHVVEAQAELDLGRVPVADVAGPVDYPHLNKVVHRASRLFAFDWKKRAGRDGHEFFMKSGFDRRLERSSDMLGDKTAEVDRIIKLFLPMDTEQAEIVATLYACWNDFLAKGVAPADEEIIEDFYTWDESKRRIARWRLESALNWMRDHSLVPTGRGKVTSRRGANALT